MFPEDVTFPSITAIQASSRLMLTVVIPAFLPIAMQMFHSIAVMLITWHGVRWLFTREDRLLEFVELLMFLAIGAGMITYYNTPDPVFGVSFSHLITDHFDELSVALDKDSLERMGSHLNLLQSRFIVPGGIQFVAGGLYLGILAVIGVARILSLGITSAGVVGVAFCIAVGPIFLVFFIVRPWLDFLFWNWFRLLFACAFMQITNLIVLMILEQFLFNYVTTMPEFISVGMYMTYIFNAAAIVGTLILAIGSVPVMTWHLFSGHGGGLTGIVTAVMGRR